MLHFYRFVCFPSLILLLAAVFPGPAVADWYENGVVIGGGFAHEDDPRIVPDGAGGAFIVWEDWRKLPDDWDVYAQRVNASGEVLWASGGIPLCDEPEDQLWPEMAAVGSGSAVIVWDDFRNVSHYDIYAQLVDASGPRWTAGGIPICTAAADQNYPNVTADGMGGAIIVWRDRRTSPNTDLYAQRVDSLGNTLWAPGGVAVCSAILDQSGAYLVPDGTGGAVITWMDRRGGADWDIYAQHVDSFGATTWAAGGEPICTRSGNQWDPKLTSDGAGGAIIAWYDYRYGTDSDIYIQRVDAAGQTRWGADGLIICAADSNQQHVEIISDGAGGAICTWHDYRELYHADIYAQRVNEHGAPLWEADGASVCAAAGGQTYPRLAPDGAGGAIITWSDDAVGGGDVYAQRIDSYGTSLWTPDGVPVSAAPGNQYNSWIAPDGSGGAIVAWEDDRVYSWVGDIYAQRIGSKGYWGHRAPVIRAVDDVPGDQGGYVTLAWDASDVDTWTLKLITYYTIWRGISPGLAAMRADEGYPVLESASQVTPDTQARVMRTEHFGAGGPVYWELMFTAYAYFLESYLELVWTLFDSTSVSPDYQYFQVIAHSATHGVFWVSEPDSGRSVDNLAPVPPLNLAGEYQSPPGELFMNWDPNMEADLSIYAVYRGATEGFVPDETNLIGAPADTFFVDTEYSPGAEEYYKVSALDIHENESGYALLRPEDISGVGPSVPLITALEQNAPNPFSPETVIWFSLAERGRVSLRVYDVEGRPVRTLVNNERGPDRYEAHWNGRDDLGRSVAPGVYFYKLEAPGYARTMKMVLLK
jgi:hypothetical protein